MKALLLTEGSSSIGHGHITRCLSLYQAFETLGHEPFLLVAGDSTVESLLKDKNHRVFDWHKNWKTLIEKIEDYNVVVVDSYLASEEFYQEISKRARRKLYIDDYKRIDYPSGIVLNGGVYAHELAYPQKKGLKYLLGPRYIPLRSAFWKVKRKNIRQKAKRILITFGGDDSKNMTPKVLKSLREHFKDLEFLIVVGKGFRNIEEISALADKQVRVFEGLSAEGMRGLMLLADIAISAGGQTTYELARVGTPVVLVAVAENQLLNCKGWHNIGFAFYAGWWEDKDIIEKVITHTESLMDYKVREKMAKVGKKTVDGKGALRVVKELIKD